MACEVLHDLDAPLRLLLHLLVHSPNSLLSVLHNKFPPSTGPLHMLFPSAGSLIQGTNAYLIYTNLINHLWANTKCYTSGSQPS